MTGQRGRETPWGALLAVVLLVLAAGFAGLLFTWMSSPSTPPTAAYSEFLEDVGAGSVTLVTQQGTTLEVEGSGGTYQVILPTVLTDVYSDIQGAAAAGGATTPEFVAQPAPDTSWLGLLLTVLLPIGLILVLVFVLLVVVRPARRERGRGLSERLRELDEAHRSGLITDDEWQRQRTRVLDEV